MQKTWELHTVKPPVSEREQAQQLALLEEINLVQTENVTFRQELHAWEGIARGDIWIHILFFPLASGERYRVVLLSFLLLLYAFAQLLIVLSFFGFFMWSSRTSTTSYQETETEHSDVGKNGTGVACVQCCDHAS